MTQGETEQTAGTAGGSAQWLGFALPGFAVLGGAVAWTVHFLGSYAVVAIGCVAGWRNIPAVLTVATLALAALAGWSASTAWRGWRRSSGDQPWDSALSEPRGWLAFLMLTGAILGGISVFAILLEGFGSLLLPVCGWDVR